MSDEETEKMMFGFPVAYPPPEIAEQVFCKADKHAPLIGWWEPMGDLVEVNGKLLATAQRAYCSVCRKIVFELRST